MIINANGVCMTQKRLVNLCRIQTSVDLAGNVLVLSYPGLFTLSFLKPEAMSRDVFAILR